MTIKEVAAQLGVSPSTISRALAHPEMLRAETRVRVLETVERLGYQPNLIARDLRRQETRLLYVVVPTLSPFFLDVFRGVERGARETGYAVVMGHTERDVAREQLFVDQVASRRGDGVILVTSSDPTALKVRTKRMPPVVAALEEIKGLHAPAVRVDHHKGAMDATNHLLALGHRLVAHIGGPEKQVIAQHRREGFNETMLQAGLDPTAFPYLSGDYAVAWGERAMETLLTCNPLPTGVFAGNDEIAIGAIRAMSRVGLQVGRDISVIGFDDQRIASLYEPALTTIKVPTEELGYRAILLLVDKLRGNTAEVDIVLPTSLIIRATTGMPRG
ncbi:LacI family DNA-binding transcriptional regulator [Sphingomonas quercus]|uniref:LacI family transcriptional regulator n=1 Tax=Sphingomonas quercus TaxID=2842451 RepID=A0ABS6BMP1_9SPHN|nr:LacI family transcriptional regulator [Sphingomonas quercus]